MSIKPNFGDDAEKRADAVINSWVANRVSMRLQRDAIAEAIRVAVKDALAEEQLPRVIYVADGDEVDE